MKNGLPPPLFPHLRSQANALFALSLPCYFVFVSWNEPPNTDMRQTGGCPQAISSEEARERAADPSLPGGVITLKSQNGGGFASPCPD